MFRFEEPAYLYLLLLLPLLAAFYLYSNYRRRKAIRKFGDPILMAQLMPDVSKYRPDVNVLVWFLRLSGCSRYCWHARSLVPNWRR